MLSKALVTLLAVGAQQTFAHPAAHTDLFVRSEDKPIDYTVETGRNWTGICKNGTKQSPIDVRPKEIRQWPAHEVHVNWQNTEKAEIANHGPAIYVENIKGSLTFQHQKYDLRQFHFHTPSEHHWDGKASAMEVHFVHYHNDSLAVLGILIEEETDANPAHSVIDAALEKACSVRKFHEHDATGPIELNKLAADISKKPFRSYSGSLTTPNCAEGVRWLLSEEKVYASKATIENAKGVMGKNARWPTNKDKEGHRIETDHVKTFEHQ